VVIPSKGRSLGLEAYGHAVVFIRRPSSVRDYCTPRSPGRVSQSVNVVFTQSRTARDHVILQQPRTAVPTDRQHGHERGTGRIRTALWLRRL